MRSLFDAWKVNPEAKAPLSPLGLVTMTLTVPPRRRELRLIWVALTPMLEPVLPCRNDGGAAQEARPRQS